MSKKTTILTIIIAAVLLLAVVAIAMNAPDKEPEPAPVETTPQTQTTSPSAPAPTDEQETATTITYTDNGFEPSSVTVKSGDSIRIENKSSMPLSFNSDDHPAHTDHGELNVGDVPRDGSRDFVITKTGTWGYHNHENATHTGKITVE